MEKSYLSYTLASGQVASGNVYNLSQLSAKFQIWAGFYGLDDSTSLACWIANMPSKYILFFSGEEEVSELSKIGFEKIKGIVIPDLSEPFLFKVQQDFQTTNAN